VLIYKIIRIKSLLKIRNKTKHSRLLKADYRFCYKDCLLLGTGVQLVVSCTVIEAWVVFEMLLALVTGQLAIASQLGREIYLWSIGLFLESGGWK